MSVQIILDRDIYLDSTVTPSTLIDPIYAGDADAQRIRFRTFQKHNQIVPIDMSGQTITAHFIRPDGGDVVITGTGGTEYSYVDLPEACYVYPGIFKLLIRASTSEPDVVTSLLYITGRIDKPTTDTIIDPGTTIPSLEDLLAQIDACEDATAAANTAAANANAAALAGVRTDTDAQGLTDVQKSNARTNIGAADAEEVSQLSEEILTNTYNIWPNNSAYTFTRYTTIPLVLPAGSYTLSAYVTSNDTDGTISRAQISSSGGTVVLQFGRNVRNSRQFTLTAESTAILLYAGETANASTGDTATWADIMITQGFEELPYVPHETAKDAVARINNNVNAENYSKLFENSITNVVRVTGWERGYIDNETGAINPPGSSGTTSRQAVSDGATKIYPNTEYTFSVYGNSHLDNIKLFIYSSNDTFLEYHQVNANKTFGEYRYGYLTFTTPSNSDHVIFNAYSSDSGLLVDIVPAKMQLELGSIVTPYTDYSKAIKPDYLDGRILLEKINFTDGLNVPDYYFDNGYLDGKVNRIESLMRDAAGNGDAFIFITDEHWTYNAKKSPGLIRYLDEHLNIPRLFSGGDVTQNGTNTDVFCDLLRKAFHGNIHHAVGNHDFLSGNTGSSLAYDMDMFADEQIGNPDKHYYYVDNKQQKIRYIVLAAYKEQATPGTGAATGGYTNAQKEWIQNVALNVPDEYKIIVFTHYFYMCGAESISLAYGADIITMLEQSGKVICIIQGHTHKDRMTTTPNGIPVFITACDKYVPYIENDHSDILVDRTAGTVTEQCFDVFVVNKNTKTIYAVRIGAKAQNGIGDLQGEQVEERTMTWL